MRIMDRNSGLSSPRGLDRGRVVFWLPLTILFFKICSSIRCVLLPLSFLTWSISDSFVLQSVIIDRPVMITFDLGEVGLVFLAPYPVEQPEPSGAVVGHLE